MHMVEGWSNKGAGTEDKQMRPRRAGGRRGGGGSDRVENNTSPPTRPRPLACARTPSFIIQIFYIHPPCNAAVHANHPPSEVTFTSDISLSLLPPPPLLLFSFFFPSSIRRPSRRRTDAERIGRRGGKKEVLFPLVPSDRSRLGVPAYHWDVTLSS